MHSWTTCRPSSRRCRKGALHQVKRAPEVRALLPVGGVPARGRDPAELLTEATRLLIDHSLFNGHPRFLGYITSSAAPIGALADLLAAAVNPNLGGWPLSPVASEIEAQTVRWIAELVGFPADCGGLLVSGGNMANFVGFLAARRARVRPGTSGSRRHVGRARGRARVYVSAETHTWVEKAADLFGLGTDAIRWIATRRRAADGPGPRCEAASTTTARPATCPCSSSARAGPSARARSTRCPSSPHLRTSGLWLHVDGAYGALRSAPARRAAGPEGTRRGRLGRPRSAQVALRAARGRLRARARAEALHDTFSVPPGLLPLRRTTRSRRSTTYELRAAELARASGR